MYKALEFIRIDKDRHPFKYVFCITLHNDNELFFYTYDDLSGFGLPYSHSAEELMIIAFVITQEKEYIAEAVKEAKRPKMEKGQ